MPVAHSVHSDAPDAENVPAWQAEQVSVEPSEYFPAVQSSHCSDPLEEAFPAAQSVHCDTEVAPPVFENLPATHN